MKTKPDLSFWKLWNLSFGFFGVQIAYALQSANVSRIFTTIGADPHDLSYFWILPPLMGLIVQPIVGMCSDRTWNRFGRRLPYLIFGALVAIIVMCLLPNAGSLHFSVQDAIIFGLIALMLLDTSINMAMQPFKMLVGDMVNEKQKGQAYSIQSFLCNAGSVVGYLLPFIFGIIGLANTAPTGEVPQTVIWAFYIGAIILMICVVYSLIKIKEWPPHVYAEYNGGPDTSSAEKKGNANLFKLLVNAPSTFWTVGLVQFFCWFSFLFLWTYATNTVAFKAFFTPTVENVTALEDGSQKISGKNILLSNEDYKNQMILSHGTLLAEGVSSDGTFYPASSVVINGNDTIVKDHKIVLNEEGNGKVSFSEEIPGITSLSVDGIDIPAPKDVKVVDYLSRLKGAATITSAAIVSTDASGKVSVEDAKEYQISDASQLRPINRTVLNAASPEYNAAGNWIGLLYAVQALASVLWAVVLPRFKSRKFSYFLSLILGAAGFVSLGFFTNEYLLFVSFILIGCAWAAMLAWPFTILTNSLKGGNIGAYLGLFNCTICIPQIVAALAGGWILSLMSVPGMIAPEYKMMIVAGVAMAIGSICVFIIKEGKPEPGDMKVQETPEISETL